LDGLINSLKTKLLSKDKEEKIKKFTGIHAAKVVGHKDLDGFFSALLTYNQYVRQGIDPKNITIDFIQYGDEDESMSKKVATKLGQTSAVVDFSALPITDTYTTLNKALDYKLNHVDFLSYTRLISKGNFSNKEGFNKFTKKYFKKELDDKTLETLRKALSKIDYSKIPISASEDEVKKLFKVKIEQPDFVSDHHVDSKGSLSKGKSGSIAKTEYKSETEHLLRNHAQRFMSDEDVKAITMVDSAGYPRLMDTLELPSDFKGKGKEQRMATALNTIIPELMKKNQTALKNLIKESKPTIKSVYDNISKYTNFNNLQAKAFEEFAKENPDWKLIDNIRNQLPKNMAKEVGAGLDKKTETRSLEQWREKGQEDLKNATSGNATATQKDRIKELKAIKNRTEEQEKELLELEDRKSNFIPMGEVLKQDATTLKNYPSRYTGSLLQDKQGDRWGLMFKRYSTMVQVAANPDLPEEKRLKLNLIEDMNKIVQEAKKKFMTRSNEWAFEVIEQESGGHKQIANLSALGTLGLMKSGLREELKKEEEFKKRCSNVGLSFAKAMPNHFKRYTELIEKKNESAKIRKEFIDYVEANFNSLVEKKYGDMKITGKPTGYSLKEEMIRTFKK